MAFVTKLCFVASFVAMITSSYAQTGGSAIPQSILDFINSMTQGNNNQALGPTPAIASQQLSLVESFGPISSSTLNGGDQTQTSQHQHQQQQPTSSAGTQSTSDTGAKVAEFFGSGALGGGSAGGTSNSVSTMSSGTGGSSLPGSQILGNDILSKVAAFVNQAPPYQPSSTGNNPTPASGFDASLGSGSGSGSGMGTGTGGLNSFPTGPVMGGGPTLSSNFGGGMGSMSGATDLMGGGFMNMAPPNPMTSMGGVPPSLIAPLQNQAMLRVGQRLGQRFGMKQYYEMHGCEDPLQLFSGRQRMMATIAMAQGCNSMQAMQVCRMAQFKERVGHSVLTSSVLPAQMRSQLEGCLSAKVLFNSMTPANSMMGMWATGTGTPSIRECGILLSSVMREGALDPESMISTRRSMLPWSCNESNMGTNGIPYRVCCPGKVHEPTLQEAHIVRGMINA